MAINLTPIESKITKARLQMLRQEPFFGSLAIRLQLVDATDWLPTAATDGRHYYYNRHFFEGMSLDEITFVTAHEVMHCVYEHMARVGTRDSKLHNIAADYVINLELQELRIGSIPTEYTNEKGEKSPMNCCIDEKYRGMSSDQVYAELIKERNEDQGDDGGDDQDGEGNSGKQGNSKKSKAGGKKNHGAFDEHIDPSKADKDNGDESGKSGPIPMSPEEREQVRQELRSAMMHAAKQAGNNGTPSIVRDMLDALHQPKINWRDLLSQHIQSMFKNDYSYQRPNKKTWGSGFVLPGLLPDKAVEVDIAIDTSGSISNEMLRVFLGEIKGIVEQFNDYKIRIMCFDTSIHNVQMFSPDNVNDITSYKPAGGGGTTFACVFEYLKKNNITPNRLVYFTDGYDCGDLRGHEGYCETLYIIHGGGYGQYNPIFGKKVEYNE